MKIKDRILRLDRVPANTLLPPPVAYQTMKDEASYICEACGEEIVTPLDVSQGASQEYVEDCPVCCRANLIHVEFDENGNARVWAELE